MCSDSPRTGTLESEAIGGKMPSTRLARLATLVIALVSLIGCRSTKEKAPRLSTVAPQQSASLAAEAFASIQPSDPALGDSMPDEAGKVAPPGTVGKDRAMMYSFGGSISSGFSGR